MKRSILILVAACILLISACQRGSGAENEDETGTETASQEESQRPAAKAAEISLTTEGETVVTDKNGIVLAQTEGMSLQNGSRVATTDSGYAWFGFGEDSLKLDRLSAAEVSRKGSNVVLLETGRIFFDIASAGRLTIRTAPAGVTVTEEASGYVEADGSFRTRLCVLSGSLVFGGYEPVTGTKKSVMVSAGQTAVCELFPDGSDRVAITISDLENQDVAVFAAEEVAGSASLKERIDSAEKVLSASAIVEGLEQRRREEEVVLASRVENAGNRQTNWKKENTGTSDEMFQYTFLASVKRGTALGDGTILPVLVLGETNQGGGDGKGSRIQYSGSADSSAERPAILVQTPYENLVIEEHGTYSCDKYGVDRGDVTVAESVGDGTVTLKDIRIHGDLWIKGGGPHSVIVDGCTLEGTIIVEKSGGQPVHLELLGGTRAPALTVSAKNTGTVTVRIEDGSSLDLVNAESAVDITSDAAEPKVTLAMAENERAPKVTVNGEPVLLTVSEESLEDISGHHFVKAEEVSSTCNRQGYIRYICKGCDICEAAGSKFSYTDIQPFAEHSYKVEEYPSTYTETGYTLYWCLNCHYSYKVYNTDFADSSGDDH